MRRALTFACTVPLEFSCVFSSTAGRSSPRTSSMSWRRRSRTRTTRTCTRERCSRSRQTCRRTGSRWAAQNYCVAYSIRIVPWKLRWSEHDWNEDDISLQANSTLVKRWEVHVINRLLYIRLVGIAFLNLKQATLSRSRTSFLKQKNLLLTFSLKKSEKIFFHLIPTKLLFIASLTVSDSNFGYYYVRLWV